MAAGLLKLLSLFPYYEDNLPKEYTFSAAVSDFTSSTIGQGKMSHIVMDFRRRDVKRYLHKYDKVSIFVKILHCRTYKWRREIK